MLTQDKIEEIEGRDWFIYEAGSSLQPKQADHDRRALIRDREEIVERLREIESYGAREDFWSAFAGVQILLADLEGTK